MDMMCTSLGTGEAVTLSQASGPSSSLDGDWLAEDAQGFRIVFCCPAYVVIPGVLRASAGHNLAPLFPSHDQQHTTGE